MAQITWRNIDAPDLTGVARLQQVGTQGIRDAISGLLGTFDQQRQLSNLNFDTALRIPRPPSSRIARKNIPHCQNNKTCHSPSC